VFVNTEGDHYRTRLTHSMEVAQIARTLARSLNLNEDLSESLSLSHDLGHTPFGHAGEEVLNKCMKNFGGFDHNIQTLRIVTLIEKKYYDFVGLNLTFETLDGLIKHNGPIENINKYKRLLKKDLFNTKIKFNTYPSLEAQVAGISDDIAYNNHDLEDGLRAGLFSIQQLTKIPVLSKLVKKHLKNIKNYRREVIISQIVRNLINLMVIDVIKNTNRNLKKIKPISPNDIYKQDQLLVDFSKDMKVMDFQIKAFLKRNMYNHKKVIINNNKGKKIIQDLFIYLIKNPKKYISNELFRYDHKERIIADFIAGMTDRYAINLHEKIK
jgi:dGTPase